MKPEEFQYYEFYPAASVLAKSTLTDESSEGVKRFKLVTPEADEIVYSTRLNNQWQQVDSITINGVPMYYSERVTGDKDTTRFVRAINVLIRHLDDEKRATNEGLRGRMEEVIRDVMKDNRRVSNA